ncbi:transcriptional regulator, HxlR family [Arboricoccus pini]|uniref:Transcriptional regulator, HxlR family n=1 Tax=Arboricoccus pini TaxID=1963835 RepID=A0A212REZ6_9PROT|nr:helix-turn-helix domain-containing protein [Arboricoccus pini]SNB70868.1 transcriptional regulator, HxlR family [Arboricoccus pini]
MTKAISSVAESDIEITEPCPIRDVLDRIGDQWSLLVLEALSARTCRFNELTREIGDISRQMLSRTLKRLEQDGFITRTVYAEVPPRVEYELTDLGRSFLVPMQALVRWADANHLAICRARKTFAPR